jgi:hypothetical protein
MTARQRSGVRQSSGASKARPDEKRRRTATIQTSREAVMVKELAARMNCGADGIKGTGARKLARP